MVVQEGLDWEFGTGVGSGKPGATEDSAVPKSQLPKRTQKEKVSLLGPELKMETSKGKLKGQIRSIRFGREVGDLGGFAKSPGSGR